MKIITVCQRKGGVGKSSSTLNLAYAFAETGHRVLVVDLDDQQNTTCSISEPPEAGKTIEDFLTTEGVRPEEVIRPTSWHNVWMLPASSNLSGVSKFMDSELGGHYILSEKLQQVRDMDYIIIDTSPSLNILVINALCASNYLFIPLSSRYFSLQGLAQTLGAFNKTKVRLNPGLQLLGLAFVIHDRRNTLANEIVETVRKQYPDYIFNSIIGMNIKVEEAQVNKQSILTYDSRDRGAEQYRQLGKELLDRIAARESVYG